MAQQTVNKQQAEIGSLSDTISGQARTISEHEEQVNRVIMVACFCNVTAFIRFVAFNVQHVSF